MTRTAMSLAALVLFTSFVMHGQGSHLSKLDGGQLNQSDIDATATRLINAAHVTGLGLALFDHGQIAYSKAYGTRDVEKKLPLTTDSVMTSASLSKAAFATMVMCLVQQGKLDLDKPIERYLPKPLSEYPKYADLKNDARTRKLTLRILLSHTGGFANWRGFEEDRKLKIHFEPGTRYAYSGEGIVLAQLIVESVTGKSLTQLMQDSLFGPTQMTRTNMVWKPEFEGDFANGYDEYGRSLGPERRSSPDAAGSMQTTVQDYAMFLSALMRNRILDTRTRGKMLSPAVNIHSAHQFPSLSEETTMANEGIRLRYGLGWGEYLSPYGKAFFKEGHDEGWRHLALFFRDGRGILIMTNSSNGEGVFKPLIDSLLGETAFPFDWEGYTPYDKLPPLPRLKEHPKVSLTTAQLSRVVGRYKLPPDIVISVTLEDGHLSIQENDEAKQELLPESKDDFYSAVSSDECSFKPTGGESAQVMVLHLGDKDLQLARIP